MVRFFSRQYGGETSNSSVLGWLLGIRPHVYQRFPHLWLFNDSLHLYLCILSPDYLMIVSTLICAYFSTLLNVLLQAKWFDFSLDRLTYIKGFPLYDYFMSPNLLLPILSPVVNYSVSSKMVWFFSWHYGGETSNSSVVGWWVGIKPHVYQGSPPILLFNDCLHT